MVMKLKVTVNGDEFSYEGEATLPEILPALTTWFTAQQQAAAAALNDITRALRSENDREAAMVAQSNT